MKRKMSGGVWTKSPKLNSFLLKEHSQAHMPTTGIKWLVQTCFHPCF